MWIKVIFLAILSVECAFGFGTGGGTSACETLMPNHNGALPQQTVAPVTITRSLENVQQGASLTLTITSSVEGFSFRGFIIQARSVASNPQIVGRFIPSEGVRTVNCVNLQAGSVATHSANELRTSVTLEWQAYTSYQGLINFHFTLVENTATFWTGLQSPFIFISPGITPAPTEVPTTVPSDTAFDPYEGCGITKVCFGGPQSGCLADQNCDLFGAVTFENDKFTFELLSKPGESYIAMALSDDDSMARSSAIECVNNNEVEAFTSFTTASDSPRIEEQEIIELLSASIIDGSIYCRVQRDNFTVVGGMQFDLTNKKHYLLLVSGTEITPTSIGPHGLPAVSPGPILLTIPALVDAQRPLSVLLMLHGSFMIVAWTLTSIIGVIIARYFRKSFTKQKICGHDTWFFWHVLCMLLTWVLTFSAIIIIFVEVGAWRTSVHSILGIIVTVFVFFQPIGAILRPKPTSKNRQIFNILHLSFGNLSQLLAFLTLFYAVPLTASTLPDWTTYILIGFVVFYLLMHATMTTIRTCGDIKRKDQSGSSTKDSKYPLLSKTMLGAFIMTVFLFNITLILAFTLNP